MIQLLPRYFFHHDDRGSIEGIINQGEWHEINLIVSDAGVMRGNHYHTKIRELFIILEGIIEVTVKKVECDHLTDEEYTILVRSGDAFIIEPYYLHIFVPKTHSRWLNVLSESIDQTDPDIVRL